MLLAILQGKMLISMQQSVCAQWLPKMRPLTTWLPLFNPKALIRYSVHFIR